MFSSCICLEKRRKKIELVNDECDSSKVIERLSRPMRSNARLSSLYFVSFKSLHMYHS